MNIGEWTFKRALTHPDFPMLKQMGRVVSNYEFNERVNQWPRSSWAYGLAKGERVATLMVNSSAFLEVFFACAKTGLIIVPLNFQLATPELVRIVGDCAPKMLIYSSGFSQTADQIKARHVDLICLNHRQACLPAWEACKNWRYEPSALKEPQPCWSIGLADPLVIMYTSGTTGALKGAVLTHENILFGAIHSLTSYGLSKCCKSLVVAPLFHIGALAASVTPVIYAGGSLVIQDFENPSEIIRLIINEKITYIFAVPVMFKMMAKASAWPEADFSSVHFFIAGGAPMPVELIRKYQEEKGIDFAQGYGMTETLRVTSLDLVDSRTKAGSIGKEVFHTLLRLVDGRGRDVPPGAVGEIIVKGPTVFAGYWRNAEATARVLRQGWFYTGDLGRRDDQGFIYIEGRKSEMIISAGENIYAVEVEQAIESLAQVAEAAVIGVPDDQRGEVVAAFIVLKPGSKFTPSSLTAALQTKIAPYKIPKKIRFLNSLPRNSAGKVVKRELHM